MSAPVQPGDLRVNRGHILRRIGRITWPDGSKPGLPAPVGVSFHPSLSLRFESLGEVAEWVARYDLHAKSWTSDDGHAYIRAEGVWEGIDLEVYGSRLESTPTDNDPDDLSDVIAEHYDASAFDDEFVCACGNAFGSEDALMAHVSEANATPIEDAPPRGIQDGDPAAAKVDHEGFAPTTPARHDEAPIDLDETTGPPSYELKRGTAR